MSKMLTLFVLAFCNHYDVRGLTYLSCNSTIYPNNNGYSVMIVEEQNYDTWWDVYNISPSIWIRSQVDLSMGDDERLGA